ncbi:hypothetical protein AL035_11070 [Salipiger aestuarii]|nr:hypothetical protein AL035_11070 [Salipiger aestuarii]
MGLTGRMAAIPSIKPAQRHGLHGMGRACPPARARLAKGDLGRHRQRPLHPVADMKRKPRVFAMKRITL